MENIFLVSFGPIQGFSKFWKLRHNKDVYLESSVLGQTKAVIFNCSYLFTIFVLKYLKVFVPSKNFLKKWNFFGSLGV